MALFVLRYLIKCSNVRKMTLNGLVPFTRFVGVCLHGGWHPNPGTVSGTWPPVGAIFSHQWPHTRRAEQDSGISVSCYEIFYHPSAVVFRLGILAN